MKADRVDYPDIKRVRVNVMSVSQHQTQQLLTSAARSTVAEITAKYKMLQDALSPVKRCPTSCSETRTLLLCKTGALLGVQRKHDRGSTAAPEGLGGCLYTHWCSELMSACWRTRWERVHSPTFSGYCVIFILFIVLISFKSSGKRNGTLFEYQY